MKLLLILTILFISGCDSMNRIKVYENAIKKHPNCELKPLIGKSFSWLVRCENGDIYYMTALNSLNAEIDTNILMFKGKNKEIK